MAMTITMAFYHQIAFAFKWLCIIDD